MLTETDLTFWPFLGAGAFWTGIPYDIGGSMPAGWLWMPASVLFIQRDSETVRAFETAGWQYTGMRWSQLQAEIYLTWGQLADIRLLWLAGEKDAEVWSRAADVEQLRAAPVALGFTLPEPPLGAEVHLRPNDDSTLQVINMAQVLPPPNFGDLGFVLVQGGMRPYAVSALGQDAQALQARLSQALRELAGPADWWPRTDALLKCASPGYSTEKKELQSRLLATRGAERERVRAQLADLETAHERHQIMLQAWNTLGPETWLARWEGLRGMARELAATYWAAYQKEQRAALRTLPAIPHIFGDGNTLVPIPSMIPIHTPLLAYSHGGPNPVGWVKDDQGQPTFTHKTEDHNTTLQVRADEGTLILDETIISSLWDQVKAFSDLDGDVFLAMLAQAMAVPRDERDDDGCVWITGAQILDYRGVQPIMKREGAAHERRAGHRQEDLMDVARCVGRQNSQWVIIRSFMEDDGKERELEAKAHAKGKGKGRRRRRKLYTEESRLTLVTEVIRQHELVMPDETTPRRPSFPVAWRYRFGTWLDPFLKEPNRKVAWLCQQALKYDPYHEQWEKRLARYFLFHLRINAKGGSATIKRNVGTLLHELALSIDERNPARTREHFERAMDRLTLDGQIDGWEYDPENPALPARKWLETWLGWSVYVSAAALTQAKHELIAKHAQARRDRTATVQALREAKDGEAGEDEGGQDGK